MIRLLRTGVASLLVLGSVIAALVGWNLWTYHRLAHESRVAELVFSEVAPGEFLATLHTPDGQARRFELRGDDWQLDARLVTWQPWAQVLGADPLYRLDRLAGRYRDTERERTAPRTVWRLSPDPGVDLWKLARDGGDWLPGVDAAYGSAVYLPMADGARYRVTLSAKGLVVRPDNKDAAAAVSTWY